MPPRVSLFLGKVPFLKLLIPFAGGILTYWYLMPSGRYFFTGLVCCTLVAAAFFLLPLYLKFRLKIIQTVSVSGVLFFTGIFLAFLKDIRNTHSWFADVYQAGMKIEVELLETPVEKSRSYKVDAAITRLIGKDTIHPVSGRLILYFKKDTVAPALKAGGHLVINKPPQELSNAGNPGGFNYRQYAFFNGFTHQVYLTEKDFIEVSGMVRYPVIRWLHDTRSRVLEVLKKYIHGPREAGLSEALLIGYRDDLDRELLQSYSDTGVVHVIAVSGMHLGLIYWLLDLLLGFLKKRNRTKWIHPVLVLALLWLFTLLTGGAASIVRAAVMFSFILVGKSINRNASVYNTLAASAFLLLCYNPYWLWDVGFQLSYTAVLSIIIFYRPLYNLIFIRNRLLNAVWQLCAVSIAAQLLTTPLAAYHFHQFPVYFLITNMLVVPLSSVILIGSLILILVSFIDPVAVLLGNCLSAGIWWMNGIIENLTRYPFAVWKGIDLSVAQVVLAYVFIAAFSVCLLRRSKTGFWLAGFSICAIFFFRMWSFNKANKQQLIVVYNASRATAIDFIDGRDHFLLADTAAAADYFIRKNVFQPAAVTYRLRSAGPLPGLQSNDHLFLFKGKSLLLVRYPVEELKFQGKVDLLVLSGNPRLYMNRLLERVTPRQIVIDASVPAWKARLWQRDCDSLHLPCYNVVDKGAFVKNF